MPLRDTPNDTASEQSAAAISTMKVSPPEVENTYC